MTTEEKLKRFRELCIEDEKKRVNKVLGEYEEGLLKSFEEHKKDALRRQEEELSEEREKALRDMRSEISDRLQLLKKKAGARNEELKEKLFSEVKERLAAFRKTDAYAKLLERELKEIEEAAGGESCELFFDCDEDPGLRARMEAGLPENLCVRVSAESFLGGTMAVISSKNIVIDNSFLTKLIREKNGFSF